MADDFDYRFVFVASGGIAHLGDVTYRTIYHTSGETIRGGDHVRANCVGCGAPWSPTVRCEYCKRYR